MSFVPPDFGGFLSVWDPRGPRALVVRYGKGQPQEGLHLTPLNLLQLRAQLDGLIEQGERLGHITEEHHRQSEQLPPVETPAEDFEKNTPPRSRVDEIAGPD